MSNDNSSSNGSSNFALIVTVAVTLLAVAVAIAFITVVHGSTNEKAEEFFENFEVFEDLEPPYTISVSGVTKSDISVYSKDNISYINLEKDGKELYWSTRGEISKIRELQKLFDFLPKYVSNVTSSNNKTIMDTSSGKIKLEVEENYITSISGMVNYKTSNSKPEWFKGEKSIKSYAYRSGAPGLNIVEKEEYYELTIIKDNKLMPHTFVYYNCEEIGVRSTSGGTFIVGNAGMNFKAPKNKKCPTRVIGISESNTVHLLAGFSY